ncbi:MAG: hypothetical protein AAF561_12815 [Planctomycetota bacterium]
MRPLWTNSALFGRAARLGHFRTPVLARLEQLMGTTKLRVTLLAVGAFAALC